MGIMSFNRLGLMGRLGNMMFQYASTLGAAKATGKLAVANISCQPSFKNNFKLDHVGDPMIYNVDQEIQESTWGFNFNPEVLKTDKNMNIDLAGYFQSPKYFEHCSRAVRNDFTFSEEIREKAAKKIPSDVCVSVHVRRGDYTKVPDIHTLQPKEYYMEGLKHFEGHIPVFFSDDAEWVKNEFSDVKNAVFISNEPTVSTDTTTWSDESAYVDMCAMSFCNGHIIANSSFSWWSAYLSEAKTVAPKQWFGAGSHYGESGWQTVYCDDWILL